MESYDMQQLMAAIQQMQGQRQSNLGAVSSLLTAAGGGNPVGGQAVMQKGLGTIQAGAANQQSAAQQKQQKKAEEEASKFDLGGLLGTAGSIAGAAIPGVGPIVSAGLSAAGGALGSAGGQAISGQPIQWGQVAQQGLQGGITGYQTGMAVKEATQAQPPPQGPWQPPQQQLQMPTQQQGYAAQNYSMQPIGAQGSAPAVASANASGLQPAPSPPLVPSQGQGQAQYPVAAGGQQAPISQTLQFRDRLPMAIDAYGQSGNIAAEWNRERQYPGSTSMQGGIRITDWY